MAHVDVVQLQLQRATLDVAQLEQVVDQPAQVLDLATDQAQVAAHLGGFGDHAIAQRLDHRPRRGQRGAQVVRDRRHQVAPRGLHRALPLEGRFESFGHVVERLPDARHLVGAGRMHARGQLAMGQARRHVAELFQLDRSAPAIVNANVSEITAENANNRNSSDRSCGLMNISADVVSTLATATSKPAPNAIVNRLRKLPRRWLAHCTAAAPISSDTMPETDRKIASCTTSPRGAPIKRSATTAATHDRQQQYQAHDQRPGRRAVSC